MTFLFSLISLRGTNAISVDLMGSTTNAFHRLGHLHLLYTTLYTFYTASKHHKSQMHDSKTPISLSQLYNFIAVYKVIKMCIMCCKWDLCYDRLLFVWNALRFFFSYFSECVIFHNSHAAPFVRHRFKCLNFNFDAQANNRTKPHTVFSFFGHFFFRSPFFCWYKLRAWNEWMQIIWIHMQQQFLFILSVQFRLNTCGIRSVCLWTARVVMTYVFMTHET